MRRLSCVPGLPGRQFRWSSGLSEFETEVTERFSSRESDRADMRAIQEFLDEALVTEILNVVRSGKEATVYRCRAHPSLGVPYVAAKVYHASGHRSFQRAGVYEEGRDFGPGQVQRAVAKHTEFGRGAQLAFWVDHEFEVLSALQYAGADVPIPFACTETAILMEYIGDEGGDAPQLQHAGLEEREAEALFERLLWNIETFIRENVVHGDLSAFNVLYRQGQLRIIDFPQAVDPRVNSNAKDLLQRDIANVLGYFARYRVGPGARREPDGEQPLEPVEERGGVKAGWKWQPAPQRRRSSQGWRAGSVSAIASRSHWRSVALSPGTTAAKSASSLAQRLRAL